MEEYCVNAIILPYSKVITVDISRIMKLGDIDNEYHIVTNRHRELATYFSRVLQIRGQQDFHYLLDSKHSFGVQRNAFKYGQPSVFFIILRRFPRIDKKMLSHQIQLLTILTTHTHAQHTHTHTQTHTHRHTHPPIHPHTPAYYYDLSGSKG